MTEARGILPAYLSDDEFVVAKAAMSIRGTYEIRLAVYFASQRNSTFVLRVQPDAAVDDELCAYIAKWGGRIDRGRLEMFSVSFTAESAGGEELDTWVLGDQERWAGLRASLASEWLRERLQLGAPFAAEDLDRLVVELSAQQFSDTNVDGEPVHEALLQLADRAREARGRLFVQ